MAAWRATGRDPFSSLRTHASPSCMGTDILAAASMRVERERNAMRPGSARVFSEFCSFKHLTVADLKADPALTQALRSLHATIGSTRPHTAASSARPLTAPQIQAIRCVRPAVVSHDPGLRASLQKLKARTTQLGTARVAHKFSALGELAHIGEGIRARGLPYTPHAGLDTVASPGPGCELCSGASNSEPICALQASDGCLFSRPGWAPCDPLAAALQGWGRTVSWRVIGGHLVRASDEMAVSSVSIITFFDSGACEDVLQWARYGSGSSISAASSCCMTIPQALSTVRPVASAPLDCPLVAHCAVRSGTGSATHPRDG